MSLTRTEPQNPAPLTTRNHHFTENNHSQEETPGTTPFFQEFGTLAQEGALSEGTNNSQTQTHDTGPGVLNKFLVASECDHPLLLVAALTIFPKMLN